MSDEEPKVEKKKKSIKKNKKLKVKKSSKEWNLIQYES